MNHLDKFLLVISCGLSVGCLGLGLAWLRARQERDKLQNRLWGIAAMQGLPVASLTDDVPLPPQVGHGRVEQLETQLEIMSQQVERLAESQDFLSRVLTDRIEQIPDSRLRTPH
jgi:hypothetical protein